MLSEKTEEGMGDVMTPEQRHKCMARIRSKNTKPEIMVRKYLFARGFRYRKNVRRLPGTPDIVLRKYRTVIFVNGCFWHGHEGCRYSHLPKSNVEFWRNKIERNKKRDLRERVELRRMGWHVIQVWECQLKPKEREMLTPILPSTRRHALPSLKRNTAANNTFFTLNIHRSRGGGTGLHHPKLRSACMGF